MRRALLFAVAVSAITAAASAQNKRSAAEEKGYIYEFKDDLLAGGAMGASGEAIKGPHVIIRFLLIRPRAQFVTEMLKSVENM